MADDRWLSFPAAVEVVTARLSVGIGRAQAVARQAIDSGEIRASYTSAAVAVEDREAYQQIKQSVAAIAPGVKMSGSALDVVRSRARRDAYQRALRRQLSLTEFGTPEFKAGLAAGKIRISSGDLSEWLDRHAPAPVPAKNRRYAEDEKLVAEGVSGIRRGVWPNPLQAATALAKRARGLSAESTVARLRRKISTDLGE